MRVFAGPNGSGKTTIIKEVRKTRINDREIDFGYYINADDITGKLLKKGMSFSGFKITVSKQLLSKFANDSGLLRDGFSLKKFKESFTVSKNTLILNQSKVADRVGQIIARFLREEMLKEQRRFSFETVFSHESNLDIMQKAKDAGYKVYLYFVSTEDPEINKYRVDLRVQQGGHFVSPATIEKRYYRSLELLYAAAGIAYQAFFFDNSGDEPFLVAHYKRKGDSLQWERSRRKCNWFKKYYLDKEK